MSKTILITGASRGFGKIWTEAFLKRGDKVVATARNTDSLNDLAIKYGEALLTLQLDVTNRSQCFDVVDQAQKHFGNLDVLINNAGYGLFGTVEEASEEDVRSQFDTNVYGTLWMTQAILPVFRNQGSGHIIQLSSVLGIVSIPLLGLYNATKFAVEAISEAMAAEVKGFGINTTVIEPIGYSTDFAGSSGVRSEGIEAYEAYKQAGYASMQKMPYGVPEATVEPLFKIVDNENPPIRVFFGSTALPWIKQVYAEKISQWDEVNHLSVEANG